METIYFLYGIGAAVATAISVITIYNVIELRKLLKRYENDTRNFHDRFDNLYFHFDKQFEYVDNHINSVESGLYEKIDVLEKDLDAERTERNLLID